MKNNYYHIFEENKDFYVQDDIIGFRGTRRKKQARDTNKNKVPDSILTGKHKEYIVKYIIRRREILLNMLESAI